MRIVTIDQLQSWSEKFPNNPYLTSSIKVSPSLAKEICKVQDKLREVDPRQVYSPQSRLHITVKELGGIGIDIRKKDLAGVLRAFEEVMRVRKPFDLSVEGLGVFPSVIYGKVTKGADEIRRLNEDLNRELGNKVIRSKYDGARMKPHVTVMHFATEDVDPLLREARSMAKQAVGSMRVRRIQLRRVEKGVRGIQATFKLGRCAGHSD